MQGRSAASSTAYDLQIGVKQGLEPAGASEACRIQATDSACFWLADWHAPAHLDSWTHSPQGCVSRCIASRKA